MKGAFEMRAIAVALLLGMASTAQALPALDIHGALAQGYVLSDGNNTLGSSTHGSRDFYEVAINGRTTLNPRLLVSGQLMARRAGQADEGKLRVDYAQLDYQLLAGMQGDIGIRLGKLKNPYGFYNDSRDVVFARPGITLPSSVYFEGAGFRDLFFSAEGAQLYGHRIGKKLVSEFTLGMARENNATDDFERSLTLGRLEGHVTISDFWLAQWMLDWDSGRYRGGLSYLGATLEFVPADPAAAGFGFGLDADLFVLSLQQQGPQSTLTFEYRYAGIAFRTAAGKDATPSDGFYLQYRYFHSPALELYLRADFTYSDRNDRDGRKYAQRTADAGSPRPRHNRFSRDYAIGAAWNLGPNWGAFAEYHYIDGAADVSSTENPDGDYARYWQKTLLMLAYRF